MMHIFTRSAPLQPTTGTVGAATHFWARCLQHVTHLGKIMQKKATIRRCQNAILHYFQGAPDNPESIYVQYRLGLRFQPSHLYLIFNPLWIFCFRISQWFFSNDYLCYEWMVKTEGMPGLKMEFLLKIIEYPKGRKSQKSSSTSLKITLAKNCCLNNIKWRCLRQKLLYFQSQEVNHRFQENSKGIFF